MHAFATGVPYMNPAPVAAFTRPPPPCDRQPPPHLPRNGMKPFAIACLVSCAAGVISAAEVTSEDGLYSFDVPATWTAKTTKLPDPEMKLAAISPKESPTD